MSILIKGMKMPEKCLDCPFMVSRDNDDCILQSDLENEIARTWNDLKANCPLVPVQTPHGRLIDADEIEYENWYLEETGESYKMVGKDDIDGMSAIIEAEGREE